MTEDHIPPKGTLGIPQADLLHIVELLGAERPAGRKKRRHMQSGVNFRSLCEHCNSSLLGATYDRALIEFSNSVARLLKSAITVPEVTAVTITPGLVARSVLGHLFALGIERRERDPLLTEAAYFFGDISRPLPDGIDIYYWVYPYRRQVAIRDGALLTDFFKSPPIQFWCLKYFPLGFMITWGNKHPDRVHLPRLIDFMLNAGIHPADVRLHLRSFPYSTWPEAPGETGAVLYGDASFAAISPRS
ncbi:MAG: hypothetical protein H0V34_05575 [Gammaproteobacteria bacterium]|nr:hypothetical protein [Gammaproteobacteria bacterium]